MQITINPKFEIGQEVYLKHDKEQKLRIVTGYSCRKWHSHEGLSITYGLTCNESETFHFHYEISETKDYNL